MSAALRRLRAEVASDLALFEARIAELATLPQLASGGGAPAQAAVALHHAYGAVEAALVRVARVLEGSAPQGADWHQELLTAMGLEIEGVRPRVLGDETIGRLRRLLSFRHFFRHAYGVALDPARLEELRVVAIEVRPLVRRDFEELDRLLRALADGA